ncbi:MAG: extracellular solute-binding protein [Hyphomicrobiales bacterium]|nr:extracellular solute-binding protein [Hyphomicrobiales bacterium]
MPQRGGHFAHGSGRLALTALAAATVMGTARAAGVLHVAFAGSMGAVMDHGLAPAFNKKEGVTIQGTGQGALALARLIKSGTLAEDVFISITPGPMRLLQKAGLAGPAVPVASTSMVIAYSPKSKFATSFASAAAGKADIFKVLQTSGLRFGRTDPRTDPLGQNIILTLKLAALYDHQPGLSAKIIGKTINPAQIFAEPSLLSRLDAGQIDAAAAYASFAASHHMNYVKLPDEVNLSDPTKMASWYSKVSFMLQGAKGPAKQIKASPLVFYAAAIKKAANPKAAQDFVTFLSGPEGQKILAAQGYGPPKGATLTPSRP